MLLHIVNAAHPLLRPLLVTVLVSASVLATWGSDHREES
jgi:hypothetical protein